MIQQGATLSDGLKEVYRLAEEEGLDPGPRLRRRCGHRRPGDHRAGASGTGSGAGHGGGTHRRWRNHLRDRRCRQNPEALREGGGGGGCSGRIGLCVPGRGPDCRHRECRNTGRRYCREARRRADLPHHPGIRRRHRHGGGGGDRQGRSSPSGDGRRRWWRAPARYPWRL